MENYNGSCSCSQQSQQPHCPGHHPEHCHEERPEHCHEEHHVHELLGSTQLAGAYGCRAAHNHRFTIVSDKEIPCGDSHIHEIEFRTDSCDGHYHEFCGKTEKAVCLCDGRHVHYVEGCTGSASGHKHEFRAATLIENPTCCE